ncbi:HHR111Cp [Eremothecium sinecaudum]|uniref:HHR111Cp n=1 Tax=Eremothecium sinecaudum TaxID=45286 RepID=A0A0X8HWU6_9SACH|nr:HHR111Cp [Eremothecium sinecaudum]AMD22880.1 HHR111Cp [Eremothecium sinecaudum]
MLRFLHSMPSACHLNLRCFHLTCATFIKRTKLPPRPKWTPELENEVQEKFLHGGSGAGGQKINKCNSKVQLQHIPSGLIVECQETRSREQNRHIARKKLAHKIAIWKNGGNPIERDVALVELARKSKQAKTRKSRGKHRQIQENILAEKRKQDEEDKKLIKQLLSGESGDTGAHNSSL